MEKGLTIKNKILNLLQEYEDGFTAREVALMLGLQKREMVAPRLSELLNIGKTTIRGRRYDTITNRNVVVYGGNNNGN